MSDPWLRTYENTPRVILKSSGGVMTYGIGTFFLLRNTSPWSGPCASCGRSKPTHYREVDGKRRRVTCQNHATREGTERSWTLCEISGVGPELISFTGLHTFDVQDALPGTTGRRCDVGQIRVSYFVDSDDIILIEP